LLNRFFFSIYGEKSQFFSMLSKTFVFDFFSKMSNINVASMRKINNFENNAFERPLKFKFF